MNKFVCFAFLILPSVLFSQDIITTNKGDEINAKVLSISPTEIQYKKFSNLEGPTYIILRSDVFSIKYPNGEKEVFPIKQSTQPAPIPASPTNVPAYGQSLYPSNPKPTIIPQRFNSVFLDLGGNGIFASVNYERLIYTNKESVNHFVALKLGYTPLITYNAVNLTGTFNIGDGRNYLEFGAGGGYYFQITTSNNQPYAYFTPTLGYRRISSNGFLFRIYMSTITLQQQSTTSNYSSGYYTTNGTYVNSSVSNYTTYSYQTYPFLGISFGYTF
jgi:hypothetical protein